MKFRIPGLSKKSLPTGAFCDFVSGSSVSVNNSKLRNYYESVAPLATAIDMIGTAGSQITPYLYDEKENQFTKEHPLLTQLKNPNADKTWTDFYRSASLYDNLFGNVYFEVTGLNPKAPFQELFAHNSSAVSPTQSDSDLYPENYIVTTAGTQRVFKREETAGLGVRYYDEMKNELWHMKRPTADANQLIGDSPAESIRYEIEQYLAAGVHNTSLLKKGFSAKSMIKLKEGFSSDQYKQTSEAIRKNYSGEHGEGTVVSSVIDQILNIGLSNKDMDFLNLQKRNENTIYNRYNIPLPLISPDNQTLANMGSAQFQFIDMAVLPQLKRILSELTLFLGHRYKIDQLKLWYDETGIGAVAERKIETTKSAGAIGVLTINELRGNLGYEPLTDGDVLLGSAQSIPIAQDTDTSDEPKPDKKMFLRMVKSLDITEEELEKIAYGEGL